MTFSELQKQVLNLSIKERWRLVNQLIQSLQLDTQHAAVSQNESQPSAVSLIGIARTDAPAPTDEEVKAMLDERLTEKYLQWEFCSIQMSC